MLLSNAVRALRVACADAEPAALGVSHCHLQSSTSTFAHKIHLRSKSQCTFPSRLSKHSAAFPSSVRALRSPCQNALSPAAHARRSRPPGRAQEFATSSSSSSANLSSDSKSDLQNAASNAPFPILTSVEKFRAWRREAAKQDKTVGFVPTMGALHEGHLGLVRQSLLENDLTVVSIFVNPAQFAPTEDLASYPRTLPGDIAKLTSLASSTHGGKAGVAAIFAPTVPEMYPSPDGKPFTQVVAQQSGAFVEVHGLQTQMEGASRPTFFRGVATVCTKLFHIVQPDLAYFGQKDIQQAIILRRLVADLLFSHPPSAGAVRVLPTARDSDDGLALSSRNVYLTPASRRHAPALYRALCAGRAEWERQRAEIAATRSEQSAQDVIQSTLQAARASMAHASNTAQVDGVHLELLYITLNDPITLDNLEEEAAVATYDLSKGAIISGAAMIREGGDGRATRLIDNILLGFSLASAT